MNDTLATFGLFLLAVVMGLLTFKAGFIIITIGFGILAVTTVIDFFAGNNDASGVGLMVVLAAAVIEVSISFLF